MKESSKGTRVFSDDGRERLFNALSNISNVGNLVCPPYIFVVCRLANEYVMIDTRVIKSQIGGSGNGIVKAFQNIENCLSWIIQRLTLSGVKGSDFQKLYQVSFPTKNDVAIFDEGDLSNDGNSPSICRDFRSIYQNKEPRDFDDSATSKNQDNTEKERGAKRKDKNDSDELTEEANDTPIQMFSSFEAKQRLQPQDWERVELRY